MSKSVNITQRDLQIFLRIADIWNKSDAVKKLHKQHVRTHKQTLVMKKRIRRIKEQCQNDENYVRHFAQAMEKIAKCEFLTKQWTNWQFDWIIASHRKTGVSNVKRIINGHYDNLVKFGSNSGFITKKEINDNTLPAGSVF